MSQTTVLIQLLKDSLYRDQARLCRAISDLDEYRLKLESGDHEFTEAFMREQIAQRETEIGYRENNIFSIKSQLHDQGIELPLKE